MIRFWFSLARPTTSSLSFSELAAGRTYPQSDQMSESEFRNYFLAYGESSHLVQRPAFNYCVLIAFASSASSASTDLIVGYFVSERYVSDLSLGPEISSNGTLISREKVMENASLFNAKSLAASYYIKPNYPSRSSHICNGGFVVPESSRGVGIGGIAGGYFDNFNSALRLRQRASPSLFLCPSSSLLAGKSFLYYAPRCGYRASIFNLVYETNQASVKIWKRLGFTTIGIIPSAGLLRTEDGKSETYVDAHVVHGDFEKIAIKD